MLEQSISAIMRDSVDRFWQRFAVYSGCYGLVAYYHDVLTAIICFLINIAAEIFDYSICKWMLGIERNDEATLQRKRKWIVFSAAQSAMLITLTSYVVAMNNPIGFQLLPLFFLFVAALYAVLNLHPIPAAMNAHLAMYGVGVVAISVRQLVVDQPAFDSHLWLQFFMVFLIYFVIIDCAVHFRRSYVDRMNKIEELEVARNAAQVATSNKDAMVAALTHDLRTPLNAMLVSAQILERSDLNASQDEYAKTVVSSGWYLNSLLSDILDSEQIAAGEMDVSRVEADLRALLKEVSTLHSSGAEEKGLTLSLEIDETIGGAFMLDPIRIKQALNNLLSNAVKFTERGTITVRAAARADFVSISVADTGMGIAAEDAESAFSRFSQIREEGAEQHKGSGLGLWISRSLMRLMDGDLTLDSTPGEGSVFTMSFRATPIATELPLAG